ncbi:MAG: hypothetical protein IKI97_12170 [Clostridia bacterium]|nr:hypothetical protein [Clostridia bacterium]
MKRLVSKCRDLSTKAYLKTKNFLSNTDGDQITGWLIVILLVVVVGAFFLNTYKSTIVEVWEAIIDKIYDTFGI